MNINKRCLYSLFLSYRKVQSKKCIFELNGNEVNVMKINFDWNNFMSKNTEKVSQTLEGSIETVKKAKGTDSIYGQTLVDISDKVTDDFKYGDQGRFTEKFTEMMGSEEYLSVQRDFITVMSNSMSASDFRKMKEEGYDISKMEPEQAVTILDKIKTVLAQSGTQIQGYNDNLSVDKITEITGNSGYAETIAKELSYADAPVTEENIERIDKVVDQALTMEVPGEGSIAYMVSQKMEPTIANLYKAQHSSINVNRQPARMTGYASNAYSRQGTDTAEIRKTNISREDYQQIEKQIKNRISDAGMEVTEESLENGKWLLEKGLPVIEENIHLLQDIKDVSFPLDIKQVIKQAAQAIGEGKSPFSINLNRKDEGVYKEACNIYSRYQKITFQAVDYAVNNHLECSLKSMENYDPRLGYSVPQIQARKTLEEVRLKMTVEANVRLLQSGFQLETASMEDLIKQLDVATKNLNESLWGSEETSQKAEIFSKTGELLKELPTLPISVVGKIPFMEKVTLPQVVQEGKNLQFQYEQAKDTYETIMTAPRVDLGDNIRKAFRNVDSILQDMDLEINESNRRAIRIMGYNQINITQENLTKIKEADSQVRNIIENMKPGMTLEMIRQGKNPLEMSMKELQNYIADNEKDYVNDSQKFSEFLYKLDKKKDITETEREAYIGIYRLLRQIEKSDGAVIGSLVNQNAEMSFSNLLSAVRTRKARHTDVKVDDSTGIVSEVIRKESSISEQIEHGITAVQETLNEAKSEKTPEEILEEIQKLEQNQDLKKQFAKIQLEEIREAVKLSGKEKDYLQVYHQPVTLDNLQSCMILTNKRGSAFKKVVELEEELSGREISRQEENILKEAEDFLDSMEKEESRQEIFDNLIAHTKDILEESIQQRNLGYLDVKELQSVYKQISVASNLSKEENYEIPVQIGEEITSINLKIVQGTKELREVKITLEMERLGKVEARFVETDNGLEGSILTDYMDGKKILETHMNSLQSALTEALKGTKTEIKSLFFGTNEKLDINVSEKRNRDENIDVSVLYKTAKEFIYYLKGIKEA